MCYLGGTQWVAASNPYSVRLGCCVLRQETSWALAACGVQAQRLNVAYHHQRMNG